MEGWDQQRHLHRVKKLRAGPDFVPRAVHTRGSGATSPSCSEGLSRAGFDPAAGGAPRLTCVGTCRGLALKNPGA